jgi:hypothetical protein
MQEINHHECSITFLNSGINDDEMQKAVMLVDKANKSVEEYFGIAPSFHILICRGKSEMEYQIISRRDKENASTEPFQIVYDDTKFTAMTDYNLREIIIRMDVARFGHYLHEIIHSVIYRDYTKQLKEALAWYFTLDLTESCKYVRPSYPYWVDRIYLYPAKKLARIVGSEFLKDFATGRALLYEDAFPLDVKELFQSEDAFYGSRTGYY